MPSGECPVCENKCITDDTLNTINCPNCGEFTMNLDCKRAFRSRFDLLYQAYVKWRGDPAAEQWRIEQRKIISGKLRERESWAGGCVITPEGINYLLGDTVRLARSRDRAGHLH